MLVASKAVRFSTLSSEHVGWRAFKVWEDSNYLDMTALPTAKFNAIVNRVIQKSVIKILYREINIMNLKYLSSTKVIEVIFRNLNLTVITTLVWGAVMRWVYLRKVTASKIWDLLFRIKIILNMCEGYSF